MPVAQAIGPLSHAGTEPLGALSGDVWLVADRDAHARVDLWPDQPPFHAYICDGIAPDGAPWEACLREFLRRALDDLEQEFGLRLMAAFEQEFYLVEGLERPGPNYSIIAHEQGARLRRRAGCGLAGSGPGARDLRAGGRPPASTK